MIRLVIAALVFVMGTTPLAAADDAVQTLPSAAEALAAFAAFDADPVHRLEASAPFLDFIRSSGEVHIVLNDALLAWMYEDLDERNKAVLYAAFLGGNMAGQLRAGTTGSDDVAGMASALRAYALLRREQPEFRLALFEQLSAAEAAGHLAATVASIMDGTAEN